MITLKRIEELGYPSDFFKFAPDQAAHFTYYMFDYGYNRFGTLASKFKDEWYLIGVHLEKEPLWFLELQLINIEDDTPDKPLSLNDFQAPYDAHSGCLSLRVDEFFILLRFLESLDNWTDGFHSEPNLLHFHRLTKEEMIHLHFPNALAQEEHTAYYTYVPNSDIQGSYAISLIAFPRWTSGFSHFSTLCFDTFNKTRLQDPTFQPFLAEWAGYMRFTWETWREFLYLLKQHGPVDLQ
jgi:hypothetical protein